jgi:hypothetical protein
LITLMLHLLNGVLRILNAKHYGLIKVFFETSGDIISALQNKPCNQD